VKLNNRHKCENLIRRSKDVRLEGIYVSPHLSRTSIELQKEARRKMKEGRWKYVWVNANQQILIRKDEKSPAIKIKSMEQLTELEEKFKKEDEKVRTRAMAAGTASGGASNGASRRKK